MNSFLTLTLTCTCSAVTVRVDLVCVVRFWCWTSFRRRSAQIWRRTSDWRSWRWWRLRFTRVTSSNSSPSPAARTPHRLSGSKSCVSTGTETLTTVLPSRPARSSSMATSTSATPVDSSSLLSLTGYCRAGSVVNSAIIDALRLLCCLFRCRYVVFRIICGTVPDLWSRGCRFESHLRLLCTNANSACHPSGVG